MIYNNYVEYCNNMSCDKVKVQLNSDLFRNTRVWTNYRPFNAGAKSNLKAEPGDLNAPITCML